MLLKLNVELNTEEMDGEMFIVVDGVAFPVGSRQAIAEVLTNTIDVNAMSAKFESSIDKKLDEVVLDGKAYDASYLLSMVDPIGYTMAQTEYSIRKANKIANKLQLHSVPSQGKSFVYMDKEYKLFDTVKVIYDKPEDSTKVVVIGCNEDRSEVYSVDMYSKCDTLFVTDNDVDSNGNIVFQHEIVNINDINL